MTYSRFKETRDSNISPAQRTICNVNQYKHLKTFVHLVLNFETLFRPIAGILRFNMITLNYKIVAFSFSVCVNMLSVLLRPSHSTWRYQALDNQ